MVKRCQTTPVAVPLPEDQQPKIECPKCAECVTCPKCEICAVCECTICNHTST